MIDYQLAWTDLRREINRLKQLGEEIPGELGNIIVISADAHLKMMDTLEKVHNHEITVS